MKHLIILTRFIVLLVTYQRSCYNPYTAAFSTAENGSNFCGREQVKSTHRHTALRCRDSTKAHKDSNMEELFHTACSPKSSTIMYPKTNSRRELFQQTKQQVSSLILASLLTGEKSVFAQEVVVSEPFKMKTIVITGANSGIGFEACKRLITKGHTIILACRSMDKAQDAISRIQQDEAVAAMNSKLIPMECDLADMSSIQRFVSGIASDTKIDTLCLNAGVARNTAATDCARTKDGFELTGKFFVGIFLLLVVQTLVLIFFMWHRRWV